MCIRDSNAIAKAKAIVSVTPYNVTYDGHAHTSAFSASGVETVPADLNSLVDVSQTAHTNAGTYAADPWSFAGNSNYEPDNGTVDNEIAKRPVTVSANTGQFKYCGQIDPVYAYRISSGNLVNDDSFSGSLTRTEGETSGATYKILQGSLSLNSNYLLTYIESDFSINGISVDASASSTPVALGNTPVLKATVTPNVAGIPVIFVVENGNGSILNFYATTGNSGYASIAGSSLTAVDVYKITAKAGSGCAESTAYLAVYDPNGGFVTGGGWINSPAGAYYANPALTGKANFGFVSKYKKGSNVPEGNTEFQFKAGDLNFSSSVYDAGTLVIAGSKATYKGTGTINGKGSYKFMVSAIDGAIKNGGGVDKFRIKIWNSNMVIYDNDLGKDENDLPTTVLGGGSVVIHEAKTKSANLTDVLVREAPIGQTIKAYPNPFTERLYIEFSSENDTHACLEIYSITGTKLKTLFNGPINGGQLYFAEYAPHLTGSQIVIYHLTMNGKTLVGKMVYQEKR
jgi:hypothetical protein